MSSTGVVIVCRPARGSWATAAFAIAAGLAWALTADIHTDGFRGEGGLFGLSGLVTWLPPVGVMAVGLMMWLLRARREATPEGFSWRMPFGSTQRVPWSSVVAIRTRSDESFGDHFELELADGRVVRWPAAWSEAKRLKEHISALLDRGAYRSSGKDAEEIELHTYGAPGSRALWWFGVLSLAILLGVPAGASLVGASAIWSLGGSSLAVLLLTVAAVALVGLFGGLRSLWRTRRAWRREVLALDRLGLRVLGGEAPRSVPWRGVRAIVRDHHGTRLDTTVGAIEIEPGIDQPQHCFRAIERHVSPTVLDAWRRENGLAAIVVAPGVHRHLMRNPNTDALLTLCAGVATTPILSIVIAVTLAQSDRTASTPDAGCVAFGCVSACLALLAWLTAVRSYVEVTEERCVLQGLVRRRSFAWAEVVDVRLPTDTRLGLSIRLRSGARLWCPVELFADRERLLDAVSLRVGTVSREMIAR